MADTMTRGQIQDLVGKFASETPRYRAALLSNPKDTIEKQLNTRSAPWRSRPSPTRRTPFT